MPSAWLQVSIRADPTALDVIANFLIERGSPGVVLRKREVQGYFSADENKRRLLTDVQRFLHAIKSVYPEVDKTALRWRRIEDRNWNHTWQRFFTPQRIGRSFLVCPPWRVPRQLRGRRLITIEPGLAFGTGTHATTRSCIELLEEVVESSFSDKFDALDVGTGSGILSIALVRLGARRIWAIDNDPVAVKVARLNLVANNAAANVRVSSTPLRQIHRSFSIVVANLTAETILELAEVLVRKVVPGGFLVLAGILYHKARGVTQPFRKAGFEVLRRKQGKEWTALLLRRS